jgi:hypothetical protein
MTGAGPPAERIPAVTDSWFAYVEAKPQIMPVAELLRSAMTGLALWWLEHPDVTRATLVQAITQTTWHGLVDSSRVGGAKP